ncbi:MAG: sigma-70 family RNA polymerase sigma factor [Phycisphaerales bacterium]|nr:MAG: sigma-70 family RNA polymerase sigma factor [Phycisphaerales bacterium]
MEDPGPGAVTRLLEQLTAGDDRAAASLLPLVYAELRRLARSRMAKLPPGQTLQPTALVHEAYVRLVGKQDPGWDGRAHFFGAAARAMRDIIVEQARRKARRKHGDDDQHADPDEIAVSIEPPNEDLLALNEALECLERDDPRKAQIVMLRYFAGLSREETAEVLGLTVRTIDREWRFIKTWLYTQLADHPPTPP